MAGLDARPQLDAAQVTGELGQVLTNV
jgi:hypothetical protein